MTVLIGVDGYPRGWVAAVLEHDSIIWRTGPIGGLAALLADASVAAIDIPIGLQDTGWRQCDAEARRALGRAGSRVFMTPPRAVLELGLAVPNEVVQAESRRLTGKGVSRQALGLATRILEVDRMLPDGRLLEVHPELSFLELGGGVLPSKKTAEGESQRIAALGRWRADAAAAAAQRPAGVPMNDALDALACVWTAERAWVGIARALPVDAGSASRIWR